jgi:hypothetical protein
MNRSDRADSPYALARGAYFGVAPALPTRAAGLPNVVYYRSAAHQDLPR